MGKGYALAFFVIVLAVLLVMLFPETKGQGDTVQIRLRINNTSNMVYVPGAGEIPSGSIGYASYSNPDHYYLASYSGSYLTGLVAGEGNSLTVSSTDNYHTLEIDRDSDGKTFLVFSQGDWNEIENQIIPIEQGRFLRYSSPSFGYGIGTYYPVTVLLRYTDIDIEGNLDQSKGSLKLTIENKGVSGERPVVEVIKS